MIRKIILIILMLLFTFLVYAEKKATLPDLLNPTRITIDNGRMFIGEGTTIYIYSLEDFTLVKKFGKAGEGPREFNGYAVADVQPDHLLINSQGKVSFFTRDGDYKKEIKTNPLEGSAFRTVGDRYVGFGFALGEVRYQIINLYDAQFKKLKEIYRQEHAFQPGKGIRILRNSFECKPYDNKIFIAGDSKLVIDVFDIKGNKLYSINHDIEKVKLTAAHKERILDYFKTDPNTRNMYDFIKSNLKLPDYFPVVRSIHVTDGKIYVHTFLEKDGKTAFLIFDTKGKFLEKRFLHVYLKKMLEPYPFTIKKGKLYQLVENIDEEEWDLYVTNIGAAQ